MSDSQQTASGAQGCKAEQPACVAQPAGQCCSTDPMPQRSVADTATENATVCDMATNMPQDYQSFESASDSFVQFLSSADQLGHAKLRHGQATGGAGNLACRLMPSTKQQTVTIDRTKPVKAACGIKVMWVSSHARRKRIATQLLDMAR